MRTINTEYVNNILDKYNRGERITRTDNIFYQGQIGTLNSKFTFSLTHEELNEYVRCSNSIQYFIEKYLNIKLRKYQLKWIDSFSNNRFIINMVSRQCAHNTIYSAILLHYMIFNMNKNLSIISNMFNTSNEFIDLMYQNYLKVPYFLKPSLTNRNVNSIGFNNGSRVKRLGAVYEKSDIVFYIDFAHIPQNILEKNFTKASIDISANKETKMILASSPNGFNLFMDLVQNSERKEGDPLKNLFKTNRTYWWEVDNRDENWKEKTIMDLGGNKEWFDQEFDLKFISRK